MNDKRKMWARIGAVAMVAFMLLGSVLTVISIFLN